MPNSYIVQSGNPVMVLGSHLSKLQGNASGLLSDIRELENRVVRLQDDHAQTVADIQTTQDALLTLKAAEAMQKPPESAKS